ncbi:MAG: NAD(P)H-binding protein [Cyclobacteriaceae bacterium]|jgi:uncharacterized protein YbjT (DUF2867 family)|nr:NAD(P)H-binding protein [Cyclobacteriaceae bacterium]
MSRGKTAVVAGATGLIGQQVVALLLRDERYARVLAFVRKPLPITHAKLEQRVVDWKTLGDEAVACDHVFCCLGTTIRKVKTKEAFREVDFTYPVNLAKATHAGGATCFVLVSALGADARASVFYNRVKGEAEEAIKQIGFPTLHVLQPSLLLGPRQEYRSGEAAAKWFFKVFGFLIPPKYKAIESAKVARAALNYANSTSHGTFVHPSADMQSA